MGLLYIFYLLGLQLVCQGAHGCLELGPLLPIHTDALLPWKHLAVLQGRRAGAHVMVKH